MTDTKTYRLKEPNVTILGPFDSVAYMPTQTGAVRVEEGDYALRLPDELCPTDRFGYITPLYQVIDADTMAKEYEEVTDGDSE